MAATLEEITIEKGHDPRDFACSPTAAAARSSPRARAPARDPEGRSSRRRPATFSAWGMLTLDVVHDFARRARSALDELTSELGHRSSRAARGRALEREHVTRRTADAAGHRHVENQEHTLTIRLPTTRSSSDLGSPPWALRPAPQGRLRLHGP